MNFISIDIETTGLDPLRHHILQLAAVLVDTDKPQSEWPIYNVLVKPKDNEISGNLYALNMNKKLIERILSGFEEHVENEEALYFSFYHWLASNLLTTHLSNVIPEKIKITAAGKNFSGFDILFLKEITNWDKGLIEFSHRTLDPGSMYVLASDKEVPNLEECKRRSEIFKTNTVSHDALDDAMDVARLILHFFEMKSIS